MSFVIVWNVLDETQQVTLFFLLHRNKHSDVGTLDADGDGDLDIWIFAADGEVGQNASWGWLLKSREQGIFRTPKLHPASWAVSWDGFVMDWDEDGDPDICVCNDFGPMFGGKWVLINDGTGNFTTGNVLDADLRTFCMGVSAEYESRWTLGFVRHKYGRPTPLTKL